MFFKSELVLCGSMVVTLDPFRPFFLHKKYKQQLRQGMKFHETGLNVQILDTSASDYLLCLYDKEHPHAIHLRGYQ